MSNFSRFIEVGRVVLINYGPNCGKLATVIDILDSKRILVDGPLSETGVGRQVVTTKRVNITDIKVDGLTRNASQKEIVQKWKAQGTKALWEKCAWAKKIASKRTRAALGDFDRFKVMVAKKQKKAQIAGGK